MINAAMLTHPDKMPARTPTSQLRATASLNSPHFAAFRNEYSADSVATAKLFIGELLQSRDTGLGDHVIL